jgi:hypothetical protein
MGLWSNKLIKGIELSTEDIGHKGLIATLKKNDLDVKLSEVESLNIKEINGKTTVEISMNIKRYKNGTRRR